jgi:hypothetical protein
MAKKKRRKNKPKAKQGGNGNKKEEKTKNKPEAEENWDNELEDRAEPSQSSYFPQEEETAETCPQQVPTFQLAGNQSSTQDTITDNENVNVTQETVNWDETKYEKVSI